MLKTSAPCAADEPLRDDMTGFANGMRKGEIYL